MWGLVPLHGLTYKSNVRFMRGLLQSSARARTSLSRGYSVCSSKNGPRDSSLGAVLPFMARPLQNADGSVTCLQPDGAKMRHSPPPYRQKKPARTMADRGLFPIMCISGNG